MTDTLILPSLPPADFCFKQFSIWHQQCAMKVNTDGILLGAWANVENAKNILDIGTGTGLIALMLAQRTESLPLKPNISALEIDENAYQQSIFNVKQSPWNSRLKIVHHDFLSWQQQNQIPPHSFDTLVSNPPYFDDSLLSDKANRNLARHTQHMSFAQLLNAANNLLSDNGEFSLILPPEQASKVITLGANIGLQLTRQLLVKTTPNKPISRVLFSLRKTHLPTTATLLENVTSEMTIRDNNNQYSEQYVTLCKDFYLKM